MGDRCLPDMAGRDCLADRSPREGNPFVRSLLRRQRKSRLGKRADGLPLARAALGEESFLRIEAEGRATKLDDAIEYALTLETPAVRVIAQDGLTSREVEIAALVAEGLTDRQIADELVISVRTAERHVGNILSKLGLATRTQVATWVVANLTRMDKPVATHP